MLNCFSNQYLHVAVPDSNILFCRVFGILYIAA